MPDTTMSLETQIEQTARNHGLFVSTFIHQEDLIVASKTDFINCVKEILSNMGIGGDDEEK